MGTPAGGQLAARLKTVRLNDGVYLVQVEPGTPESSYRFLAFPFADAWPVNHAFRDLAIRSGPAQVRLSAGLVEPTEGGRSLLAVPWPAPIHSSSRELASDESVIDPLPYPPTLPLWGEAAKNQERLVLPDSFARMNAVITVRKGEGWQPFSETYAIEPGVSDSALRQRDLRLTVIWGTASNSDLEQLVRRLSYGATEAGSMPGQ